jgi:uncharacterized membrane protein YjjB (DUF3815 family)
MFIVAFVAQALSGLPLENGFCFWSIIANTCLFLFPGVLITVATLELVSGKMVNGVVKLFYSLLIAIIEGICLAVGRASVWWSSSQSLTCVRYQSEYWSFLMYPFFVLSLSVVLNANRKQWPAMWASAASGFIALKLISLVTPHSSLAIIGSAFTLSLSSQLINYAFGIRAKVMPSIYCGIFTLLPGSFGVRGGIYLLNDNFSFASDFLYSMMEFLISISIGFFSAQPFMKCLKMLRKSKSSKEMRNLDTF